MSIAYTQSRTKQIFIKLKEIISGERKREREREREREIELGREDGTEKKVNERYQEGQAK